MTEQIDIVMDGSKMIDWQINIDTAEKLEFVNAEMWKIDSSLPEVKITGGHYDDKVAHAALKQVVTNNWAYLGGVIAEGGSCYNTGTDAEIIVLAMFGDAARKSLVRRHITKAVVDDALVFNLPSQIKEDGKIVREKYLCAYRDTSKKIELTDENIQWLTHTSVYGAPLSTPNGYPELTRQALKILENENSDAKKLITFHGCNVEIDVKTGKPKNPVKYWDIMNQADAWVGNHKELGAAQHRQMREDFKNKGDTVQVTTRGEHGLEVETLSFHKFFPAVDIWDVKGTAGAGNGVEGATLIHLLGKNLGDKDARLDWLGQVGTVAYAAATTFPGTTLKPEDAEKIKEAKDGRLVWFGRVGNAAGAAATTFEGTTLREEHAALIKGGYNYQVKYLKPLDCVIA